MDGWTRSQTQHHWIPYNHRTAHQWVVAEKETLKLKQRIGAEREHIGVTPLLWFLSVAPALLQPYTSCHAWTWSAFLMCFLSALLTQLRNWLTGLDQMIDRYRCIFEKMWLRDIRFVIFISTARCSSSLYSLRGITHHPSIQSTFWWRCYLQLWWYFFCFEQWSFPRYVIKQKG